MNSFLQTQTTKLFRKHLEQYVPQDPMYETYTDSRGRQKRRRRQIPPGLSKRDAKILKSVQRRAHYLDKGFSLCGFKFGWTAIIGLIPGAGDAADIALNYFFVVRKARQADLPWWLVRQMLLNNSVSACVGLIPIAGDLVLAMYKANSRNAALLEEFLRIRGEEFLKLQAQRQEGEGPTADALPESDVEQVKPGHGGPEGLLATTSAGSPKNASRSLSFASWRSSMKDKKKGKSPDITALDRGKFVEDVGSSAHPDTLTSEGKKVQ